MLPYLSEKKTTATKKTSDSSTAPTLIGIMTNTLKYTNYYRLPSIFFISGLTFEIFL